MDRFTRKGKTKEEIANIRKELRLRNIDNYKASERLCNSRTYINRKAYTKKWCKEHRFNVRITAAKYRHGKRLSDDGTVTKEAIQKMLEKQKNNCNKCGADLIKYHIDHIHPISKGGVHSITNIQILCVSCNCSKRDTIL